MSLALYEVEPIGLGGALEATTTYWFCSEECRQQFECESLTQPGENNEYEPGTVCDECGKELPDPHAAHSQTTAPQEVPEV